MDKGKNKQIDKEKMSNEIIIDENYAIIDNRLAYSSQEVAEQIAEQLGCGGYHTHEVDGVEWFMPCETH